MARVFSNKDQPIFESRLHSEMTAKETEDIKELLSEIPDELHLAINRIASQISRCLGYTPPSADYNFLDSTNPRAIGMCRFAVISVTELQEFCMDVYGTSLEDLVEKEE